MIMKTILIGLFVLILYSGCKNRLPYGKAVVEPETILSSSTEFINYWRLYLDLSKDFTGFDTEGNEISKKSFLKELGTGKYLPVRLSSDSSLYYYRLYKINTPIDNYTKYALMGFGNNGYNHYLWEGATLPEINFQALSGKWYNRQTMFGKLVILDFWFIGCTACVREMPRLNHLVDSYKNSNVLFLSIAFDKENDLRHFLKKTEFKFEVISDTTEFLNNKFGIVYYPSQVIIGKDGKVIKILDDHYHRRENLFSILKEQAGK